jgi:hypothetical protein
MSNSSVAGKQSVSAHCHTTANGTTILQLILALIVALPESLPASTKALLTDITAMYCNTADALTTTAAAGS